MMHFDWYQVTIPADASQVIDALARDAGSLVGGIERSSGRHGYASTTTIADKEGRRIMEVLHGGQHDLPNAVASGSYAEPFAESVRERWPQHRVTRADVAQDVIERGAFETLEAMCRDIGAQCRVKGRTIVPDDPSEGRTYYLGSPKSDVRTRLYDKTAESRSKLMAKDHDTVPDHWTRLEVQVRPKKHTKELAAQMEPAQFWGFSRWTRLIGSNLMRADIERVDVMGDWAPDQDRAVRYMVLQYRKHLERLHTELGNWHDVGALLGEMIAESR